MGAQAAHTSARGAARLGSAQTLPQREAAVAKQQQTLKQLEEELNQRLLALVQREQAVTQHEHTVRRRERDALTRWERNKLEQTERRRAFLQCLTCTKRFSPEDVEERKKLGEGDRGAFCNLCCITNRWTDANLLGAD